eukprot:709808-Amorphochlora_amoeboformis.AAC.1
MFSWDVPIFNNGRPPLLQLYACATSFGIRNYSKALIQLCFRHRIVRTAQHSTCVSDYTPYGKQAEPSKRLRNLRWIPEMKNLTTKLPSTRVCIYAY